MKLISLVLLMALTSLASAEQANSGHQCAPDGIALGGYDAVSYHQGERPKGGDPAFSAEVAGLTYQFISEDNLATFEASPEKYLPVYQGWCAATLSMGQLTCPDYTNFKIENGRLLLFELAGFTNGRSLWNSDPEGFRQRADSNFEKLVH
ncbi:MAG: YHS domain-containing (seleno)protein [Halieaceae bacterium]